MPKIKNLALLTILLFSLTISSTECRSFDEKRIPRYKFLITEETAQQLQILGLDYKTVIVLAKKSLKQVGNKLASALNFVSKGIDFVFGRKKPEPILIQISLEKQLLVLEQISEY